jgi:hypothetical protein
MKISKKRLVEIIREELETLNEGNDQFMHILKMHGFKQHGRPWAGHYFFKGPKGYYATLNPKARYLDISKGNRSVHNDFAWTSLVRFFAKQGLRKTNEEKLTEARMVSLNADTKYWKKVVKVFKKLRLKSPRDYDLLPTGRNTFTIKVNKKYYDKVLEVLIKNKIKVHGT